MTVNIKQIEEALDSADFPMMKDDLVAWADESVTDEDVRRTLRSLPRGQYENVDQIVASVDTAEAGPQRSISDKR